MHNGGDKFKQKFPPPAGWRPEPGRPLCRAALIGMQIQRRPNRGSLFRYQPAAGRSKNISAALQ